MIGQLLITLLLVGMCLEVGREAFGVKASWSAKHFTRMTPYTRTLRPPRDWWTEKKTKDELRIHQRRWHIDLVSRSKNGRLRK